MFSKWLAAVCVAAVLVLSTRGVAAEQPQGLLRVFLTDGSALVSFGEPARVGDRVIFSMPTSVVSQSPLQLVSLSVARVDWERTSRYAATARETRYLETQAELDYTALSNDVTETLSKVTLTNAIGERLALAERARKTLAEWPLNHYNYRQNEVRQMLTLLDEAIADLRVVATPGRFDLTLTAFVEPPAVPREAILPAPTAMDLIEQAREVARLVDSAPERMALLEAVVTTVRRERVVLPLEFVRATRAEVEAELRIERSVDRSYQLLTNRMMPIAERSARAGNVTNLEAMLKRIDRRDRALGRKRPDAVAALIGAVEAKLDAARRLQLARDHWQLRAVTYDRYRAEMKAPTELLAQLKAPLENIKALTGSSATGLALLEKNSARVAALASLVSPPEELVAAHALFVSAAHLAVTAARIRRDAAMAGDMTRAWDASSAAAGALMLADRAKNDIQSALRLPQLK